MFRPVALASVAAAAALWCSPAWAIDFGSSSTTGKGVTSFPLRFASPDSLPVGVELGLRVLPGLSDALGPAGINPTWLEAQSSLLDADIDVDGHFPLVELSAGPLGRIRPVLSPFLGYRYMGALTTEGQDPRTAATAGNLAGALNPTGAVSYSQFGGINYGVKAGVDLPLGFEAHTGLGLTTLISGGWDTRQTSASQVLSGGLPVGPVTSAGKVSVGGATLPSFTIGASWNAWNMLELYVGYDVFQLPTGMRSEAGSLSGARSTLNNFSIGARIFSFSI